MTISCERVGVDRVARNQLIPNKDDNDADNSTSLIWHLFSSQGRSGMNQINLAMNEEAKNENEKWPLTKEMINKVIKADQTSGL
jgi:hypothetical protein